MAARNVTVTIILRARNFASAVINGVRGSALGLRNALFSTRTAIEAFAAGIAVHALKSLFDLGSQAEETANKFNTVFGDMSEDVDKFLKTFGILGGLSEEEGQAMVATTGQIAQGLGFAQNASASFSKQVLKLAVDMGSFNNAPTKDVLDAINSGLTGIIVPLKQYGIVMRETDIQQKAMAMTGKTTEKSLTQQEKATAALALITQKAGVAVGDMERTQDSTANTARRLGAELTNVKENFGQLLVSSFKAAGGFGNVEQKIKDVNEWLDKNKDAISLWGAFTIKVVGLVISVFKNLIKTAFNAGQILGTFLDTIFKISQVDLTKKGALTEIKRFWDEGNEVITSNFDEIKGSANDVADALNEVALAGQNAAAASKGEFKLGSGPKTIIPKKPPVPPDEGKEAEKLKKDVTDLTKAADSLQKKFELGLISADAFRTKAIALGNALTKLGQSAGITDEQTVDLRQAWVDLNKAVASAPKETVVKALTKQSDTLQEKFKTGLIDINAYVDAWEQLRPALMALRDSGELTDEQLLSVQNSLSEINSVAEDIASQPLSLITGEQVGFVHDFAEVFRKLSDEGKTFGETMGDAGIQFARDFGGAIEDAFSAMVSGSKSAGEAFKEAMLGAIASVARAQGEFYLGKALGALGEGFLGNPAAFASAAKFTAAAAIMFALAGGIQGLGSKGSSGGGGAAGGTQGATRQASQLEETKGDATLIIQGGALLDMNDPDTEASLAAALESLSGRRVIIRKGGM